MNRQPAGRCSNLDHRICLAKRLLTTKSMMMMVVVPSTTTAGQVTQVFGAAGRPAGVAPEHSATACALLLGVGPAEH
jgi:hypothetical protein